MCPSSTNGRKSNRVLTPIARFDSGGALFAAIPEIRVAHLHTDSCRFVFIRVCDSILRLIDQGFAHRVQNLLLRREKDESLLRDDFIADAHGELADVALDQFGLRSEFAFKHGRHTGGSGLVRRSGFAVADGDGVHGFFKRRTKINELSLL